MKIPSFHTAYEMPGAIFSTLDFEWADFLTLTDDVVFPNPISDTALSNTGTGGDDLFIATAAAEPFNGGAGIDTVSYENSTAGILVNISNDGFQESGGGFSDGDSYFSIENITGSDFSDTIIGSGASNILIGLDGTDSISDQSGLRLNSTSNNGVIEFTYFSDADTLLGGDGEDFLTSFGGVDTLDGGNGNDMAIILRDPDFSIGVTFVASATGAAIFQGYGLSVENVETFQIELGFGNDSITTLDGDDMIALRQGTDFANGLGGNDDITALGGNDTLYGGSGDDTLRVEGDANSVLGEAGNDELIWSQNPNNQTLAHSSTLDGGDGDDSLAAGSLQFGLSGLGNLTVIGGAGQDNFFLWAATETIDISFIEAATGASSITSTGAPQLTNFTIEGVEDFQFTLGSGDDHINFIDGMNIVDLGAGDNFFDGGSERDVVSTFDGNNEIYGRDGDDVINTGAGDDEIFGGDGVDSISVQGGANFVYGEAGGDSISAGEGTNRLDGGGGEDSIFGGIGSDTIIGGLGQDILEGGEGDDILYIDETDYSFSGFGGDGYDRLIADVHSGALDVDLVQNSIESATGSAFNDRFDGGAATVDLELIGLAGDDLLIGGTGADSFDGGEGIDTASYESLTAGVSVDLQITTAQNTGTGGMDTLVAIENLIGTDFFDMLTGDASANRLDGRAGDDSLFGMGGDDLFIGGAGNDLMNGGSGSDTVSYEDLSTGIIINLQIQTSQNLGAAGSDTLIDIENIDGTDQADQLTGNASDNRLVGNDGDDVLRGGAGEDDLDGGAGNDRLEGSTGSDTLFGGTGMDILIGGSGNDVIDGWTGFDTVLYSGLSTGVIVDLAITTAQNTVGAGVDTLIRVENLIGSGQADTLSGNFNRNRLEGGAGDDIIDGRGGNDTILGGAGNDDLTGGTGADRLIGGAGEDDLFGGDQRDRLEGGADNDMLFGGSDVDRLLGGDGEDILVGGAGTDFLFGGSGNDTFRYDSLSDSGVGVFKRDEIRDWNTGDLIDVSAIDADTSLAGDQAFTLAAGAFTGTAGEIQIQSLVRSGVDVQLISFDVDGDASADMQLWVLATALSAADFIL